MPGLPFHAAQLESVGWFIPPYMRMGWIEDLAGRILKASGKFTSQDLERALSTAYEPFHLSAMILHRYPQTAIISEYQHTIREAIVAHFLGLGHVAVGGLAPTIEGAARQLARQRNLPDGSIKTTFEALADDCKTEVINRNLGATDEVASMLDSFKIYATKFFYANSQHYPLDDGTNRHGILHGSYTDQTYGRPLGFYKTISAVDFLTFVSSIRNGGSWMAPNDTDQSRALAAKLARLPMVGRLFVAR